MKKTAILCILLLACAAVCSSTVILRCKCLKTIQSVNPYSIADVSVYEPRPYCKKQEVIVKLKNNKTLCLDPTQRFTQEILQHLRKK